MYYCEKCNSLSDITCCDTCGNKNLRVVKGDDFCFLIACEEVFGKMLIDTLKSEGINYATIPFGNGVRSQFGLTLGNYKIYVPYEYYDKAQDILDVLAKSPSFDSLKNKILENIDKWHIDSAYIEKKIRKKFKLVKEANVIEYIKEKVQHAQSIEDVGLMMDGEHGLLVRSEGDILWFSSESYKISI